MKIKELPLHSEVSERSGLRQRVTRRLAAPVLALSVGVVPMVMDIAPAHADGLEYTVQGTKIGVRARLSPHDADAVDGRGAYDGDTVKLICGVTNGDVEGDYNNHTWHLVEDKDRPQARFWITDHFVSTPPNPNHLAPGEPECDGTSIDAQPKQAQAAAPANPPTPHNVGGCKTNWAAALVGSSEHGLDGMPWSQAWAQELSNDSSDIVCVGAQFSDKDEANRRQFIGKLAVSSPATDPGGCAPSLESEVWAEDVYKKTNCTEGEWEINKWLPFGTNVCAAFSDATDMNYYKDRQDADKAAAEGKVKLGQDDPSRAIACVHIG